MVSSKSLTITLPWGSSETLRLRLALTRRSFTFHYIFPYNIHWKKLTRIKELTHEVSLESDGVLTEEEIPFHEYSLLS